MTLRELTITKDTPQLQDAFIEFVPRVFPEISFRKWRDWGGWDDGYVAFALAEGERIVASASRQRMRVVLNGRYMRAWQLSAVGTLPEWRGRGLQQDILQRMAAETPAEELVFLFANDTVLHFYPRFGFRRLTEWKFRAACALAPDPALPALRTLDLTQEQDRALLLRVAASTRPVTEAFGAYDHGRIVLWYGSNYLPNLLRYVPEHDAIVAVAQEAELLQVFDVLTARPFDLQAVLARTLSGPISHIELGFSPERIWPSVQPAYEFTDGPLFVRGNFDFPTDRFKFPMLAQT